MGCSQSTVVDPAAAPRPQPAQATAKTKAKTTKRADPTAKNNKAPAPAAGEEQSHQAALQRREVNTTMDDENSDAVAPEFAAAPPMSIRMERPAVVSTVGSLPLQMPSSVRCNVSSFNISFIDPTSAPSSRGTESNIDSTSSNYNFLAAAASESKIRTGSNRSVRFEEDTVTAADLVVSSEFDQEEEDAAPASAVSIDSIEAEEATEDVVDDAAPAEEPASVEKSTTGSMASADSEEAVGSQEAAVAVEAEINAMESVQRPVNVAPTTETTAGSVEDTVNSVVKTAAEDDAASTAVGTGKESAAQEGAATESPIEKQES